MSEPEPTDAAPGQPSRSPTAFSSEERYRLMVEAIPMMAWQCDADGGLLEANSRWYAYTGQTIAAARGSGWMQAVHPDDRTRVAKAVTDDVRGGTIYQADYRLRRASDGQYRWHLARALPVRDASGRIAGWFGSAADIHDQKAAEELLEQRVAERTAALQESEARLQRVLAGSMDGYWEWELPVDQVTLSPRCREILGLPGNGAAVTRRDIQVLIHPDDRPRVAETVNACLCAEAKSDHYDLIHRHCRPDGTTVWLSTRATVTARGRDGQAIKVSGAVTDITVHRLATEALRQRTHQLAELAAKLTVAESRERRRLSELLHDHVQQFLVGARMQAHALAGKASGSLRRDLETLSQTIDEALASTRVITTDLAPPLPLNRDLGTAMQWLAQECQVRHRLEVTTDIELLPKVMNESVNVLLFTAARELLLNVVKHAGTTQARLELKQTENAASLTVADQGNGVDWSAAESGHRRGLGLFSIRERAELLGGSVEVQSSPGHGMRVRLALPLSGQIAPTE